ncbi:MAG TPA: polymer-forming cytoskeletal protein, partial [Polyangiales bacterium]|nr:polymer-forming cytoskeletal protein [Polyangiales bacterium]
MKLSPTRLLLAFALLLLPRSIAHADVNRRGDWPDPARERITLSVSGSRSDALHELADAAGWSVVIQGTRPIDVDVKVKDQPAVQVLDLLLDDDHYVATRRGNMISIAPLTAAGRTPPPAVVGDAPPPSAASKPKSANDRIVAGHSITIGRDEVIGDLTVLGGSADVFGTISGDAAVMGGSIELHPGAHVYGDISAVGGSVEIAPGARVDGDVNSAGGSVERGDHRQDDSDENAGADGKHARGSHREGGFVTRLTHTFLDTTARAALLFAFGTVLLAL